MYNDFFYNIRKYYNLVLELYIFIYIYIYIIKYYLYMLISYIFYL